MIKTTVYESITKTTLNQNTGEIKDETFTKKVTTQKTKAIGWNCMYKKPLDLIFETLNSNLEIRLVHHIRNKFTKNTTVSSLCSAHIAKEFRVSRNKVSRLITRLVRYNLLMQLDDKGYRLNPFIYVPLFVDGYELQVEWEKIISEEKFLRRGLSLTEYELIEEGKLHIPTSTKILKY